MTDGVINKYEHTKARAARFDSARSQTYLQLFLGWVDMAQAHWAIGVIVSEVHGLNNKKHPYPSQPHTENALAKQR